MFEFSIIISSFDISVLYLIARLLNVIKKYSKFLYTKTGSLHQCCVLIIIYILKCLNIISHIDCQSIGVVPYIGKIKRTSATHHRTQTVNMK